MSIWAYIKSLLFRQEKKIAADYDDVVVLDTETTSLEDHAKILSVAAIPCKKNQCLLEEAVSLFLKWEDVSMADTPQIHGITKEHLRKKGIAPLEALRQIRLLIGEKSLVGHHISFDLMVLNKHFTAFGLEPLPKRYLCTAEIAKRLERPQADMMPSYSLDALCQRYQIPVLSRHTAAGDTLSTAYVWLKLRASLIKRSIQM